MVAMSSGSSADQFPLPISRHQNKLLWQFRKRAHPGIKQNNIQDENDQLDLEDGNDLLQLILDIKNLAE